MTKKYSPIDLTTEPLSRIIADLYVYLRVWHKQNPAPAKALLIMNPRFFNFIRVYAETISMLRPASFKDNHFSYCGVDIKIDSSVDYDYKIIEQK